MNLKERIHPADPRKNTSCENPQTLSNTSQNLSSTPSEEPLNSLAMPELLMQLQRYEMELRKIREESNDWTQERSMLLSQISELKQVLDEQKLNELSEKQMLQSKIVELTEELAREKQQKHRIETQNQKLVVENDDLRNYHGLRTREQEESLLNENNRMYLENEDLKVDIHRLQEKVDMSSVEAVEDAEKQRRKALWEAKQAQTDKEKAIDEIAEERKNMETYKGELQRKQYLTYGLLAAFLLASSYYHPQIWIDLRSLLEPVADWVAKTWIGSLLHPGAMSGLIRWISLLGLPILICIPGIGIGMLLICLWRKRSIRSVIAVVTVFGLIVFFGEFYPGNTLLLLMELFLVIRLIQYLKKRIPKKAVDQ